MRLAISQMTSYHVDKVCADSRSGKRLLREQHISLLVIDYFLVGRENGADVLSWARRHRVLPGHIVITERDRDYRYNLVKELYSAGFKTLDDITFIRR